MLTIEMRMLANEILPKTMTGKEHNDNRDENAGKVILPKTMTGKEHNDNRDENAGKTT
jgi:hypothetical protein